MKVFGLLLLVGGIMVAPAYAQWFQGGSINPGVASINNSFAIEEMRGQNFADGEERDLSRSADVLLPP
ncbi:MAG: hypothetical protein ACRBEQ_14700, partial [Hyphomonas sp.]